MFKDGEDVNRLVLFYQMTEAKAKETLKNESLSKYLFEAINVVIIQLKLKCDYVTLNTKHVAI